MSRQTPLAELAAAEDYAGRVTAATSALAGAQDEGGAVLGLKAAADAMGVDAAAFVSFVRDDASHESFRFLLACDPVWCIEYERQAWYATDPWLEYALGHTDPARGQDITVVTDQQRAVLEVASRFGFRSALIVPAPSSGALTRVGVLCLGSSTPAFFNDDGYLPLKVLARSLAMELHEWWIARCKRELIAQARLSEEDIALLAHERRGMCTKTIASTLDTSANAVNSRFQRVNAKLGVPNRKAAAQLAAEYGVI